MGEERQAERRAGAEAGRRFGGTAVRRHVPLRSPGSTGWRRVLGVSFGVAVLVGNTILIGILRTPGERPAAPSRPFHRNPDPRGPLRLDRGRLPGRARRDVCPPTRCEGRRTPKLRGS